MLWDTSEKSREEQAACLKILLCSLVGRLLEKLVASGLEKTQSKGTPIIGYFIPASVKIKAKAAKACVEWEILDISFHDLLIA